MWEKEQLVDKILGLEIDMEKLKEENAKLRELLKRNSKNSSTPPSKDKKKESKATGKPLGSPKGHKGGTKVDFGVPDKVVIIEPPKVCPHCKQEIEAKNVVKKRFQAVAELVEKPIEITEYIYEDGECPHCKKPLKAETPINIIPKEQYGPRRQAWLDELRGYGHLSSKKLVKVCKTFNIPITQGTLNNQLKKLNKALSVSIVELKEWLKNQPFVHMDETGWRKRWMWTVATKLTSLLEVRDTRGAKEVEELIGKDYNGVIICDRAKCYVRKYKRQLCWSHLKRDTQACAETKLESDKKFAKRMSKYISEIFHPLDQKENTTPLPDKVRTFLKREWHSPPKKTKSKTLRNQLLKEWDNLWRFISNPDIPPDNNEAERTLRLSVTHRKVCGTSRTVWGAEAISKLFSVIQTCNKQNKSVLDFIKNSLLAYAHPHLIQPSLLPYP